MGSREPQQRHLEALTAGAGWAFTSDACELLLIDVSKTGPAQARVVDSFPLANFKSRRDLESAAFLEDVLAGFSDAHQRFMPIALGTAKPAGLALDEVFVNSLRALLFKPVAAIRQALDARRQSDPLFEQALVRWMVDEQGWPHDVSNWEAEVDRTAHLTAYVFTTRLMFYESLRRTHTTLSSVTLPNVNASVAKSLLAGYFTDAREKSGDYETIFAWDQVAEYALLSDATVPGWTRVLEHLAGYELSTIGHDVIGRMFERLIRPEERSRWGQFYTSAHVADLMLSFGLPDGSGSFLDPASGGGTLLVRGYARKRQFDPDASHQDLLKDIFGADISAFAATLSTVNLAARDPQFSNNYPRVAATSFFKLSPGGPFVRLPALRSVPLNGEGQVGGAGATVDAGDLDAVISNPPYVRVQELTADTKAEAANVLGRITGHAPTPRRVHGLSNYHVYFWLHAGQFLRPGGRLVFITAGEWLDSD